MTFKSKVRENRRTHLIIKGTYDCDIRIIRKKDNPNLEELKFQTTAITKTAYGQFLQKKVSTCRG